MAVFRDLIGSRSADEPPWDNSEPIKAELFNVERLEQHAESLANAQKVLPRHSQTKRKPIAKRLDENAEALISAYETSKPR
jgi:cyclic beta-1,2-glucan synthetase